MSSPDDLPAAAAPGGGLPPLTWKQRIDAYEQLVRLDKPIGILLLLWPTLTALWIASSGAPSGTLILVFTLGTIQLNEPTGAWPVAMEVG